MGEIKGKVYIVHRGAYFKGCRCSVFALLSKLIQHELGNRQVTVSHYHLLPLLVRKHGKLQGRCMPLYHHCGGEHTLSLPSLPFAAIAITIAAITVGHYHLLSLTIGKSLPFAQAAITVALHALL